MATKFRAVARIVGQSAVAAKDNDPNAREGGSVADMVDTISRHKKFKQLATYSLQWLEKAVCPPNVGWEAGAKQAMDLGAPFELADIAGRFANDGEFFGTALSCIISMSYLPRALSVFFEGPTAAEIIKAVQAYTETIEWRDGEETIESVERLNRALGLMESMARHDGAAFAAAGGIPMLLKLSNLLAPSNPQSADMPNTLRPLAGSIVLSATNTLDGVSRASGGLEALLNNDALKDILSLALTELPGVDKQPINGHLSPCFRVLDRVARNETGRDMLLGLDATATILKVLSVVTAMKDKSLESLVMRVLGRLMGSSVEILINRIEGYYFANGERYDANVTDTERDLAARLLINVLSDSENRATMLANEAVFVKRLIDVMTSDFAKTTTAPDAWIGILAAVAAHTPSAIVSLFYLHSISATTSLLLQFPATPSVLEAGARFYNAMLDCETMATFLAKAEVGHSGTSPLVAVLRSFATIAVDTTAAAQSACVTTLSFLENLVAFGLDSTEFSSENALVNTLKTMMTHPGHIPLQIAATDFFNAVTDREEHVHQLMKEGVTGPLLRNLRAASPDSATIASASTTTMDKLGASASEEPDADVANSSSASATAATDVGGNTAHLIASSMYLITTLCVVEENVAKLKAQGVLQSVLGGFRSASNNPRVYRNFREVIMALKIEEKEVTAAINSVSIATAQLQHILTQTDPEPMRATAKYVSFITGRGITFPGKADLRDTLDAEDRKSVV